VGALLDEGVAHRILSEFNCMHGLVANGVV
jgi:hypothetical protein